MDNIEILKLDKETAEKYIERLLDLESLIPMVEVSPEKLLAESKGDRIMYSKWKHSLYAQSNGELIGFLMAYERKSEDNDQYPLNSLYLNTIVVSKTFQGKGLGHKLVHTLIDNFRESGFLELKGEKRISVQTNNAEFNKNVQSFYESFGFRKISEKEYDNRTDNVYVLDL